MYGQSSCSLDIEPEEAIAYHLWQLLRPFPYEGSISKSRDKIDVSPNFLDSRFRRNVDYKLRFEVLLARPLGFPCQQEGISKFLKTKWKFLHTLKIPSIGENITLVIYHFHHCVVIHHHYNCHCCIMSSSSSTSSAPSDDSDNESSDNDNQEEEQETEPTTKMSPYHAKNYFDSTMGGKDLRVLFGMAIGFHTHNLPDHKDPPFSKSKAYLKPDAATLKLEVVRQWKAYTPTGHQPCPSNWKIDKCIDYLMSNPIPTSEKADLDWLESELDEWKGIQVMINEITTVGHQTFPFFVYIIHWLRMAFEVPLEKHTMLKPKKNWMEGTPCSSKTSMN